MSTKIPYVQETWNVFAGCSKISDGCDNCYAEKMSFRLSEMGQEKYSLVLDNAGKWAGKVYFDEEALGKPSKWDSPRMIFVNSMSDTFHLSVPFSWIDQVIQTIITHPEHTFLILTKRPERMNAYFEHYLPNNNKFSIYQKLNHLWLGVTAENQITANNRIPLLLRTPAARRFVSVEPMLGPVNLTHLRRLSGLGPVGINSLYGASWYEDMDTNRYDSAINKIDWVICGEESGPRRRPLKEEWVRNLKNDCARFKVPFFLKQLYRDNKKELMPSLDGEIYDQAPLPLELSKE
jgi:protein gp37